MLDHPDEPLLMTINECPHFEGELKVYHSAVATFYMPSDLSGVGGMCCEQI